MEDDHAPAVKAATLKDGDVAKFRRPVGSKSPSNWPVDFAAFRSANLALPIGAPSHNLHSLPNDDNSFYRRTPGMPSRVRCQRCARSLGSRRTSTRH